MRAGFWEGNLEERDHLGDLGVDWNIILKLSYITCMGGYGLDNVVRDREKWGAVAYWLLKGPVS